MSGHLQQEIFPDQPRLRQQKNSKRRQLSTFSFVFLSSLMTLTSMMVMVRLHQFDQLTEAATIKYAHLKQNQNMQQYIKQINEGSLNIITDFRYESAYLLPIVTMVSIFFLLNFKLTFDKLHDYIRISVVGTLICFLITLITPQVFFIYRITYILHVGFLIPLLLISSFCFYKLMPFKLIKYRQIYCLLMFMLPFLGEPFEPYITNLDLSYNLNLTSQSFRIYVLNIATIGSTISALLVFFLIQMKDQINKIIFQESQQAYLCEKEIPLQDFGAYTLKKKKKVKFQTIFGVRSQQFLKNVNQKVFMLTVMGWALLIALGSQIPRLQQATLNVMQPEKIPSMRKIGLNIDQNQDEMNGQLLITFTHMNLFQEILTQAFAIALSIGYLKLSKKIGSISLMMLCYFVSFGFIILLMTVIKGYLNFSFGTVRILLILQGCFIQALIIPAIYTTNLPITLSQKATIILFTSKLFELVIRTSTEYIKLDSQILVLGLLSAIPILLFTPKQRSKTRYRKKYTPSIQSEFVQNAIFTDSNQLDNQDQIRELIYIQQMKRQSQKKIQNDNLLDHDPSPLPAPTLIKQPSLRGLDVVGMHPEKIPQNLTINIQNIDNVTYVSVDELSALKIQTDKYNESNKELRACDTSSESQNKH